MQITPGTISNTKDREFVSNISTKGQITLPQEIRNHLGLKAKDTVVIRIEEGDIKVSPARATFLDSFQAVLALSTPLSFEEIRRIAREEHAKEAFRDNS